MTAVDLRQAFLQLPAFEQASLLDDLIIQSCDATWEARLATEMEDRVDAVERGDMKLQAACMKVFFTDAARTESIQAFDFYQERSEKVAANFLQSLEHATVWLTAHPTTGKPLSSRTRRHLMKTFPYLVIYRVLEDAVWVVGVVHEKRDPNNWQHLI